MDISKTLVTRHFARWSPAASSPSLANYPGHQLKPFILLILYFSLIRPGNWSPAWSPAALVSY
jgi:hypothetical protein